MKKLLLLAAMLLFAMRSEATAQISGPLLLNGDLLWNITEPQCGFKLKGSIRNISAVSTGPIRLVLWASKQPYPSTVPNTTNAIVVGQFELGGLGSGFQFESFTVKTSSKMPLINGVYYFTIAVVEYVNGVNYNRFLIVGGAYELVNGVLPYQEKWEIPGKPVVSPPDKIVVDDVLKLQEKATGKFNKFPAAWQKKIKLTAEKSNKMRYVSDNLEATVSYSYSVVKTNLKGDKELTGRLVMTYGAFDQITFKDTIYLYFTGPHTGFYKSVATGILFDGDIGDSTTWGLFDLN